MENANTITEIINEASAKAGEKSKLTTFYVDEQGLRRCKLCDKRLETIISIPSLNIFNKKVNCVCDCNDIQRERYREEIKRLERQAEKPKIIHDTFSAPEMASLTFKADDAPKSEQGQLSRRWVAHYEQNKVKGDVKWLFFYGGCGTGKTFYAACIANAMLDRGYTVKMVTASEIAAEVFSAQDKAAIYSKYNDYELLIIDDIGAERQTDYMFEIVYSVVNNRYNMHKALIMTSNMTTEETGNPKDKRMERIMSRVWERGYPMEFTGKDRRKAAWNDRNTHQG